MFGKTFRLPFYSTFSSGSISLIQIINKGLSMSRYLPLSFQAVLPKNSQLQTQTDIETYPQATDNKPKKKIKQKRTTHDHFRAPRRPVVLAHGLFGYNDNYWGSLPQILQENGVKVHVAKVPAVGSIKERSEHLYKFIKENCQYEDINIVGHSMGGLDSRYLITHFDSKYFNVRSLTTICTPHRGSPLMDWIRDHSGIGKESDAGLAKLLAPFNAPGFHNLTTEYMTQKFNPETPNSPNVQYFSYGASVKQTAPSMVMKIPWKIVSRREGANDGVVSVFSSKWGEYLGTVPADHFDLNRPRTSPSSIVSPIQNAISSISTTIASSIVPDGAKSQKDDYLLQYQHRINQVLNHLGGPNSFDDYLYGQDYLNTHDKWAQCTLDENSIAGINGEDGSFDVAKFYLGVMNRLFKDGFPSIFRGAVTNRSGFYTRFVKPSITGQRLYSTKPEKVVIEGHNATIHFNDGKCTSYSALWLRDHCKCEECNHPTTKQRLLDTVQIPKDIKVVKASHVEAKQGPSVSFTFSDNHTSLIKTEWLRYHSFNPVIPAAPLNPQLKKVFWDNKKFASFKPVPAVSYDKVMQGDEGLAAWLKNIEIFGFSFIEGVPISPEKTAELAKRICFIRESHYGGFWDFTSNLQHGDTAYTNLAIGGHTDSTYFTDPVGLQLFHLLEHRGEGGHTLLVDAFNVAYKLRDKHPEHFKILSEFNIPTHSAGDENVFLTPTPRACGPLIKLNPLDRNEIYQIRFNNHDRSVLSPRTVSIGTGKEAADLLNKFYDAWRVWMQMVREKENEVWVKMTPGTAMIVDNWRTLHGRSSFTGYRRLCGAYLNMDDYKSRVHMVLNKGKIKEEL